MYKHTNLRKHLRNSDEIRQEDSLFHVHIKLIYIMVSSFEFIFFPLLNLLFLQHMRSLRKGISLCINVIKYQFVCLFSNCLHEE